MNRDARYRNEDADPLNVNGITFEFSVDDEETELSKLPIRTVVAKKGNNVSPRESRKRSPPPHNLTRENSSSTKNSESTRGSTDSEGSLRNRQAMHIDVQGRQLNKSVNPSGKRSSMSTLPTICSSNSSVVTERSDSKINNNGFQGKTDNNRKAFSSGASVVTSKTNMTAKSASTEKTNGSDDTVASDADRAQRRIEREQLLEKKRVHEERRNASANQSRRPQLIKSPTEQIASDRSMDLKELQDHRHGGVIKSSNESSSSIENVSKSILKQGRFSLSDSNAGSKQSTGHDSKISNASCGKVRFHARERLCPHKRAGVSFSETTTVFHDDKKHGASCGSFPQHGYNHIRHIAEDGYGRQHYQRGYDSYYSEPEGALRMQRGAPAELLDMRRRNPTNSDARPGDQGRSPPRGSVLGRPDAAHSMEARQNGHPVPLTSIRRQLTPQEHQHLVRRQQEHQQQQLQAPHEPLPKEKVQRKGLFGRKTVSPPIELPQLTHNQIRMAAAQAAFAMVGENQI